MSDYREHLKREDTLIFTWKVELILRILLLGGRIHHENMDYMMLDDGDLGAVLYNQEGEESGVYAKTWIRLQMFIEMAEGQDEDELLEQLMILSANEALNSNEVKQALGGMHD